MLSERIIQLRKRQNMSQSQLARALNISPSAVGMYEQGRRVPSLEMLAGMAALFQVSLDYLITGKEFTGPREVLPLPKDCPCASCYWRDRREG